jgi:hypothetical protein
MIRPSDDQLKQLGGSLREIDPSALAPDPEGGQVRWFLGAEGTEVYIWAKSGHSPHHVQLVFSRVSVEWNDHKGLVTGTFRDAPTTAGGRYDTYILTVGQAVDPEVCSAALVLLEASSVERATIDPLISALRAVPRAPAS